MKRIRLPGVYEILNVVNRKRYIGSSTDIYRRLTDHRNSLIGNRHHNHHLQASFNKYGVEAFTFRPMLICSQSDLLLYEQMLIDGLKPEYNKSPIAGTTLGRKMSDWAKVNIGNAKRGKKATEEAKHNMSVGLSGRKLSEEHKQKIRQALMGHSVSVQAREKVSKAKTGIPANPESIKRGAAKRVGHVTPEEVREKIRKAQKGVKRKPLTQEQKEKMSVGLKQYASTHHQEESDKMKRAWVTRHKNQAAASED